MEYQGMTRRQALAAAGIAGVAATVATAGVAMAEEASEEVSEETQQLATEFVEADIIVVGAGGGGECAALVAATYGADSVLVLESANTTGGNTLLSHGGLSICGTVPEVKADSTPVYTRMVEDFLASGPQNESEEYYWPEITAQYEEYLAGDTSQVFDSPLFMSMMFARSDEQPVDFEYYLYERMPEFIEWYVPTTGAEFTKSYGGPGYSYPHSVSILGAKRGEKIIDLFEAQFEKYNIDVRTSTPAVSLIVDDDGAVLGVNGKAADGHRVAAYAKRAVVLAAGGFEACKSKLMAYNTMWPYKFVRDCMCDGVVQHDGSVLDMAQAIGAGLSLMDMQQCLCHCDAKTGAENTVIGNWLYNLLRVTHEGVRFINESSSRFDMTRAIIDLPEQHCLLISDNNNSTVVDGYNEFGVPIAVLQDLGTLFVADTLEELAEQIGADPETFVAQVDRWNGYCDTGVDEEFGNNELEEYMKVLEPPFYAYEVIPAMHITYGGVITTHDTFQVLKYDEETPIEGLYGVGDVRSGCGGVIDSMADAFVCVRNIMQTIEPKDCSELIAADKQAEEDAAAAAAAAEAAQSEEKPVYVDGTYTGSGNGMGGVINVTVEVKDGVVTVTDISPNNETPNVGGYEAIEDGTFVQLIEDAQSSDFDGISGATITSSAIKNALDEALAQAIA